MVVIFLCGQKFWLHFPNQMSNVLKKYEVFLIITLGMLNEFNSELDISKCEANAQGSFGNSSCCRRLCVPGEECAEGIQGCASDEDCLPGELFQCVSSNVSSNWVGVTLVALVFSPLCAWGGCWGGRSVLRLHSMIRTRPKFCPMMR